MGEHNNNLGYVQYFKNAKTLPCGRQTYGRTKSWAKTKARAGEAVPIRTIQVEPTPSVKYELDCIAEINFPKGVITLVSGKRFYVSGHEYSGGTGYVDMLRPDDKSLMAAAEKRVSIPCQWGESGQHRLYKRASWRQPITSGE